MVDYFKVEGAVSNINLNHYCVFNKRLGKETSLYKLYNDKFTEHLNLITMSKSNIVIIKGNLRTWMYGSKTLMKDLNYNDFVKCIESIAKKIGASKFEVWSFYIKRIEIGANLKLGVIYRDVFSTLLKYGKHSRVEWKDSTLYFDSKRSTVKFYSKIEKVFKQKKMNTKTGDILNRKAMVLRVEIDIKKKSTMPYKDKINTLGDIKSNFNYIIDEVWLKIFDKVEVADTLSSTKDLHQKSKNFTEFKNLYIHKHIKNIGLVKALRELKTYSKFNKPEEKKKLIEIFKSYQTKEYDDYFTNLKSIATHRAESLKCKSVRNNNNEN